MPRGDQLKFKHTVVDNKLMAPPEQAKLHSVPTPVPAPPPAAAPTPVEPPRIDREVPPVEVLPAVDERSKSTLMRWTDTEAIVRVTAPTSFVLEEAEIPADIDPRLVVLYAHASEQARAYRLLRHRLRALGDPRVIAVTSAEPAEGKTTCAANLALALADETMARVLLVEANLRRPALGAVFGYEPSDSFMRRLADHRDASPPYGVAAIRGTRLHVAALPPQRARETHLDRLLLDAALGDLRSAYDYVVVDSAAVLESADADIAGECSDGVILVGRSASSRRSALEEAVEQLHPTRILGTVLLDT